jgi:hypothetical protein
MTSTKYLEEQYQQSIARVTDFARENPAADRRWLRPNSQAGSSSRENWARLLSSEGAASLGVALEALVSTVEGQAPAKGEGNRLPVLSRSARIAGAILQGI